MSVTHIAGFPVQIGTKYRQRCAWCEAVLVDGDLAQEMVAAGSTGEYRPFEIGALVDVAREGPVTRTMVVPHVDGEQLPANACVGPPKLRLVSG